MAGNDIRRLAYRGQVIDPVPVHQLGNVLHQHLVVTQALVQAQFGEPLVEQFAMIDKTGVTRLAVAIIESGMHGLLSGALSLCALACRPVLFNVYQQ